MSECIIHWDTETKVLSFFWLSVFFHYKGSSVVPGRKCTGSVTGCLPAAGCQFHHYEGAYAPSCRETSPIISPEKPIGLLSSGSFRWLFPPGLRTLQEMWREGKQEKGGRETQLRKSHMVAFPCTINCQGYFWQREKEKGPDGVCLKLLYVCPDGRENGGIKWKCQQ